MMCNLRLLSSPTLSFSDHRCATFFGISVAEWLSAQQVFWFAIYFSAGNNFLFLFLALLCLGTAGFCPCDSRHSRFLGSRFIFKCRKGKYLWGHIDGWIVHPILINPRSQWLVLHGLCLVPRIQRLVLHGLCLMLGLCLDFLARLSHILSPTCDLIAPLNPCGLIKK
ncbi:uncharacterized protein LOC131157973 isoform X1 [Malania oleifera]|uniref:uncharacterized protein LOC131157973 isoform X1 n=1 Tax=Malania oleifera TaxID=397392 RepID=UPI0025ADE64D|nr:uncharacterized protein LOC131157973 isoform X1 [Malania oleifera]